MSDTQPSTAFPTAIHAAQAPLRTKPSNYPEPFASMMQGREKRALGDLFGLSNFGVNYTRLPPGALSALRHAHTVQDEFIYILEGHPTLHTNSGKTALAPGMCAGFKAGTGDAHPSSMKPSRMWSTSKWATARPVMRPATPMKICKP